MRVYYLIGLFFLVSCGELSTERNHTRSFRFETFLDCNSIVDDQIAIQSAIDTSRKVILHGSCFVDSLNVTNQQGLIIEGSNRIHSQLIGINPNSVILDLSGSSHVSVRDLRIVSGAQCAAIGILMSQTTAGYTSDAITLSAIRIDGCYTHSAIYNLGVASSYIEGSAIYNYQPGSVSVIFTGVNLWGVTSNYVTLADGFMPSDWTIIATEVHNFGESWAWWFGGARSVHIYGGNASTGYSNGVISINAVIKDGTLRYPDFLILDGTTLYGDELTHKIPDCGISGLNSVIATRSVETTFPHLLCHG